MRIFLLLLTLLAVASCKKEMDLYNGYIDSDLTYLSSDFSGRLSQLGVKRGELVAKNQLLFKIEQTNESRNIALSKTNQTNLAFQKNELEDKLAYAAITYQRVLKLRKSGAASLDELDNAKQNLNVLQNQLKSINAQLKGNSISTEQAVWQLERKQSVAPESGIIFDNYYYTHEFVPGGAPIVSLITKDNIKVIFYVSEEDLAKVSLGQKVSIKTDGDSKLNQGIISYISAQAEYTPPIIFSREDRQKLVFRVEARLKNPDLRKVHLGQPVSLELK